MKTTKISFLALSVFLVSSVFLTRCGQDGGKGASAHSDSSMMAAEDPAKHGEYLVMAGGCNHCHSPKVFDEHGVPSPDPTRL